MASKQKEHYLTEDQLEYFRAKLINWKNELMRDAIETKDLVGEQVVEADAIDSACNIVAQTIDLRTRERARKLIKKIDEAIRRIDDGTYGYCEETGNPIGLRRLEARPVATLCIEAQEMHERMERDHRDDVMSK